MKTCVICKETLDDSCFYSNGGGRKKSRCNKCYNAARRLAFERNPEKYKSRTYSYSSRRYKQRAALNRKQNPEERRLRDRELYQKNRETKIASACKYIKKRRKEDPYFRMSGNIRRRISLCLKQHAKSKPTEKLIGCTFEEFRNHLESLFTKGMSWDNYGFHGWHIDHIKPCKDFDLSLPEEQEKCFHYTNCRPLWGTTTIALKHGEDKTYIGNFEKGSRLSI